MSIDLLVTNARLPDGREGLDIACEGGRIVAVERGIEAEAGRVIDAGGNLVSPPFVDAHFHLDSALSCGTLTPNHSEAQPEEDLPSTEREPLSTREAVTARALAYCDLAVSQGLLAIRSHVDICDDRLLAVEALLDVKEAVRDYIDVQLVAFPQNGYYRSPTTAAALERALDMGVDVVGGYPQGERTRAQGEASLKALCEMAADRGLRVDIHCDETDDPLSRFIETLAFETQRLSLHGRVAASPLTSLHSMDNDYVSRLLPEIAEAGIHVIANPLINILRQGRYDTYPRRRGLTRVPELRAAGVNVSFGQDRVMESGYTLGSGDMLEVAHMALHVAQMSSREDIAWCFEAVTAHPARAMGLEAYGLEAGCNANFVVLQARDTAEAIRLRAARLFVVRQGRVIAEGAPRVTMLNLPGRPALLDPAAPAG